MDSPTTIRPSTLGTGSAPGSAPSSNDDGQRVKFLCSFLGNIMPRPQDGKLRYVGGETRIVSVPRDIGYERRTEANDVKWSNAWRNKGTGFG